jgi:hypothetical protein
VAVLALPLHRDTSSCMGTEGRHRRSRSYRHRQTLG